MGMPSRQISPQSFDEILTELGDDPAIPDPHGIRKPGNPKTHPKIESPAQILNPGDLKKIALFAGLGIGVIGLGFALFASYDPMKTTPESHLEGAQKEISELKKELGFLREEILVIEDEIYESMDLIEVSVHLLKENKTGATQKPKLQATPFESELRRWRYLGLSQTGSSQFAFFHNGKETIMLEKGALLLGDWRLAHADKEIATLTHPQGKSLTLKPSKPE
jgi:hypothetical protein